jgi:predicted Zn-dependent protease
MAVMRKTVLLLAVAGLAIGPAAAQRLHYLDPRDVAEAQRDNAAMVQALGGAETGPRAAYVEAVGRRVGGYSGVANAGQALHFTTLNSAVENAFSVPGGYVYVTRQLLGLMDDESELAFALGHEVGHVAANHAHQREQYVSRGPLGWIGRAMGSIFGGDPFGGFLERRAILDALQFSREQEYQADELGIRYMTAAGYDPAGSYELLAALSRASALEARVQGQANRQTPEWASTHPLNENRMQVALEAARATGRLGTGIRNREQFLGEIEGLYVDDDPAQGIIDGATFTHPDLRIQFTVPQGYLMQNAPDAVTVSGSAGKAQFRAGPPNLDQAITYAFQRLTGGEDQLRLPAARRISVNGMPVAVVTIRVPTDSGQVDASVVAYQWDPTHVYYFAILTPAGYGLGPFLPMVNSVRKISAAEAAAIRPRVIHIETVRPGDTLQSLASRMAYRDFKLERFLSLNGLAVNSSLKPGQKVKLVVFGTRRS